MEDERSSHSHPKRYEEGSPPAFISSRGGGFSTPQSCTTPAWYTILNERLGMFSKAARSRAQARVRLNHSASLHLKVKRRSFPLREKRAELTEAKVRFGPTGRASLLRRPSKLDHVSENSSLLAQHWRSLYWKSKLTLQKYGCKRTQTL